MKTILTKKKIQTLKECGVALVFLFGSKISGPKRKTGDLDIGLVFKNERRRLKKAVDIYGSLYDLFQKHFSNQKIDLVYVREGSYALQYRVVTDGQLIYAVSPDDYANYREEVLRRYFDFKPIEDLFNQTFAGAV